jgi:antitoxin FitA
MAVVRDSFLADPEVRQALQDQAKAREGKPATSPAPLALLATEGMEMSDLLVRGVDEAVVKALKKRAGAHGRSAEAEHRAILAAALLTPARRPLAELLASMPDVGRDDDFERQPDGDREADVVG